MTKKRIQKHIVKEIKNISASTLFIVLAFLLIGAFGGYFAYSQICKNDTFEVLGEKRVSLEINETYNFVDAGVKIISLGKDISDKVKIETNIPTNSSGDYIIDTSTGTEYYVIYMVDDIKYGNIQKVRLIIVGEGA